MEWLKEFSNERREDLDSIESEHDLFDFLKNGKVFCRLLMILSEQEIKAEHGFQLV